HAFGDIDQALEAVLNIWTYDMQVWVCDLVESAETFSVISSTGITLPDYLRFQSYKKSVHVGYGYHGDAFIRWHTGDTPSTEDTRWAYDFAVNSIIRWQSLGISPSIPPYQEAIYKRLIANNGAPTNF